MSLLSRLFGFRPTLKKAAREAHDRVMRQARRPDFYLSGAAADTLEGRFDMATLHAIIVMRRLRGEGDNGRDLAQALFDVMFSNLDHALRENGVGDTKVATRMREMGESFYGQARALDAALDDLSAMKAVEAFFARNGPRRAETLNAALAGYTLRACEQLDGLAADQLSLGQVSFPEPDELAAGWPDDG